MSGAIHVEKIDRGSEQAPPKIILDTRVWNEKMPSGVVRIECPDLFAHERSFRVRIRRKGLIKYEKTSKVRRGSTSIELILSRDEEKIFQTGNSTDPFRLEVLDETSSLVVYSACFYRFKSDKSKLYKEISMSESSASPSRTSSRTSLASSTSYRPSDSIRQTVNPVVHNVNIDKLFERGQNRLERSLQHDSYGSDSVDISSIKPSILMPHWVYRMCLLEFREIFIWKFS